MYSDSHDKLLILLTENWQSTNLPQWIPRSGLEFLRGVERLDIQQTIELHDRKLTSFTYTFTQGTIVKEGKLKEGRVLRRKSLDRSHKTSTHSFFDVSAREDS